MSSLDEDMKRMVRRNKLLGMWAAEKLGLSGESARTYSNDLAMGTVKFERSDVVRKVHEDFDAAGVAETVEEIQRVANAFWLQAAGQRKKGGDVGDAAALHLARNLLSR